MQRDLLNDTNIPRIPLGHGPVVLNDTNIPHDPITLGHGPVCPGGVCPTEGTLKRDEADLTSRSTPPAQTAEARGLLSGLNLTELNKPACELPISECPGSAEFNATQQLGLKRDTLTSGTPLTTLNLTPDPNLKAPKVTGLFDHAPSPSNAPVRRDEEDLELLVRQLLESDSPFGNHAPGCPVEGCDLPTDPRIAIGKREVEDLLVLLARAIIDPATAL